VIGESLQVGSWPHYWNEPPLTKVSSSRVCLDNADSVKALCGSYAFGGDLLKVEDVNYKGGNPKTGSLRTVPGYAISGKRYALMEGTRIIEVKGHGLGYLMSPASKDEPDWLETAWQYALRLDQILWDGEDPEWLNRPAMMKIPVSSPAVLGRLKGFCKPGDFVLAPILRSDKLDPDERAEKPLLITRFNKHSGEWLDATYYNVRTGKKCRITVGERENGRLPVKTYREISPSIPVSPRIQVCRTRRKSVRSLDARRVATPSHRRRRFQVLRERSETKIGARSDRSRPRFQMQGLRKRSSSGRARNTPTVGRILRTGDLKRNWAAQKTNSAVTAWGNRDAEDVSEDNRFPESAGSAQ
jgi:hypothetical protein